MLAFSKAAGHRPRLLSLHIEVTPRCDQSCIHCFQQGTGSSPHHDYSELSTRQLRGILDQAADMGVLLVTLSGGEPFLRPDFLEIVTHARKRNFLVRISTNGGHIDDAAAEALARLSVFEVRISVFSDSPRIHDRITRRSGSHAAAIDAARRLRERSVAVRFNTVIMPENSDSWIGVRKLAERIRASFLPDPMVITTRELGIAHAKKLQVSFETKVAAIAESMYCDRTKAQEAIPSGIPAPETFLDAPLCGAGSFSAHVSPAGELYPCILWPEAAGDLTQETLANIWERSRVLAEARNLIRRDAETCRECRYLAVCATCPALSFVETGSLIQRSSLVCERTRAWLAARGIASAEVPP